MIVELKNLMFEVVDLTWPMLFISMVVLISLRLVYFFNNKEKPIIYQELLKLLFIIYILCLFQIVTYQDISFSGSNYQPFKEIFRYEFRSYLFYRNILGNMLLFLPYGLFVSYFSKVEKASVMLILSFLTSFSIELTQLSIGRVFDIDDIILNVLGALLGFLIFRLLNRINDKIPKILKREWLLNLLVLLLLILIGSFLVV